MRYWKDDVFVASRSFPIGTVVRIVNLRNGKAMTLPVRDRAPGFRGREFDFSARAADLIGMRDDGVVSVMYEVVAYTAR